MSEQYAALFSSLDQTLGDASIGHGLASTESFAEMMRAARRDEPGAQLIVKRHPGCDVRFVNHSPEILRLVDLANLGGALGDPLFIAASPS